MTTWLDKLCEPLLHPKYPQIKGVLYKTDLEGNIIGKCAEGEILCQNDILLEDCQFGFIYGTQFRKLGVPHDLYDENILPAIIMTKCGDSWNIGNYILTLNDQGFTYPEIEEFLRTTFEDAV